MAIEWFSTCKDCDNEFGYSDDSYRLAMARGQSRPERCPNCRRLHSREISTIGLSHFELIPARPVSAEGLVPGRLGKIDRAARVHFARPFPASYDLEKFGIKDDHIRAFFEVMQQHQVVVAVAPTGAGKSTLLPYRLMIPPEPYPKDFWTRRGQIIITQPRIQATRNISDFVASKLHGSSLGAGYDVGFKHSGSPATDRRNKIVYMTDGSLINMIVRNEIGALSVIMIDEAHERSLNIDLILGLLKEQLPKYPHLKLIVASATIDSKKFLTYYGAPEIDPDDRHFLTTDAEGSFLYKNDEIARALEGSPAGFYGFPGKRQYPVETRYRPVGSEIRENRYIRSMPEEVANKVFEILLAMTADEISELTSMEVNGERVEVKGDILAFLQGERPIKEAVELITQKVAAEQRLASIVDVLPLYTKLPQNEQDRALKSKETQNRIRVVVSTNVAETSLTVEGIVHVVDSGLINEKQWEPETQTGFVTPQKHSQAGCCQRWGRAGRVQPGIAHCLYSKEQFEGFPKNTLPEIARAPIDQIILTAKAAGAGDITKFNWIQPPSPQELTRAPAYLWQIGALDAEGDLTSHGLELRSYPAEIEYANLMILADRFGCAVEMATLLPMLELGGYAKLLRWDRNWDAPTKRAVYAVQRGLLDPCEDDVEFYLKLWDAWEGTRYKRTDEIGRKQWSDHFFVNHEIFDIEVTKKRATFLDSLAGHKKSNEVRPISFDLIDKVRILMTYGLCNHIYQRSPHLDGDVSPVRYQPYIAYPDRHPELVELHRGVTVEISPESVLHGRMVPDYFVCGKRQRRRKYVSSLAEPETVISAAFIAKIKPDWLAIVEQPIQEVIQLIHRERRLQNEGGDLVERLNRLFIDQLYPVGAVCEFSREVDDHLRLVHILSNPGRVVTGMTYEEIDDSGLAPVPEAEGELAPKAGVSRGDKDIATAPDETDDEVEPIWAYLLDDIEQPQSAETITLKNHSLPMGTVIANADRVPMSGLIEATISGYVCAVGMEPVLKLRPALQPDPFDAFCKTHIVGESYDFEIAGVEHYDASDPFPMAYLIVRDRESRLEIGLDRYDAGLTGCNYAVDYLKDYQGKPINVTVEKIQKRGKLVRLTRLPQAEAQMLNFLGVTNKRVVDARIMEARENGMHLWLEPDKTTELLLPCGGFARIQRLPKRPDEMVLGKICRVQVKSKNWEKRTLFQAVRSLPEKVRKSLEIERLGNNLTWDPEQHGLSAHGRISYIQRNSLLALWDEPAYQKAIHNLFRRSNEFDLSVLDSFDIDKAPTELRQKGYIIVTITEVNSGGARVRTDDGWEIYLDYSRITAIKGLDLADILIPGQVRILNLEKKDAASDELDVNILRPEDNLRFDYPVGRLVVGVVSGFLPDGSAVFLTLQSGMKKDAFLPHSEVSFEPPGDLLELFKIGQPVEVRVVENDLNRPGLRVSRWRLHAEQRLLPENGFQKLRPSSNAAFQKIQRLTHTFIQRNGRIIIVEGPARENVQAALQQIEAIVGAPLDVVPIIETNPESEFLVSLSELQAAPQPASDPDSLSAGSDEFGILLTKYGLNEGTGDGSAMLRVEVQLTPEQYESLTRTDGNEFERLFGLEQSLLSQIAAQSGVKFELDSTRSLVTLVGNSEMNIAAAQKRIELALENPL